MQYSTVFQQRPRYVHWLCVEYRENRDNIISLQSAKDKNLKIYENVFWRHFVLQDQLMILVAEHVSNEVHVQL